MTADATPIFRRLADEARTAARDVTAHLPHRAHRTPDTSEEQPVDHEPMTEEVRSDLTDGMDYLAVLAGRLRKAAPGFIDSAAALGNSTVAKLAEALGGKILPADAEADLISIARVFISRFGQDTPAAGQPDTQPPAAPAGTVADGAAPVPASA